VPILTLRKRQKAGKNSMKLLAISAFTGKPVLRYDVPKSLRSPEKIRICQYGGVGGEQGLRMAEGHREARFRFLAKKFGKVDVRWGRGHFNNVDAWSISSDEDGPYLSRESISAAAMAFLVVADSICGHDNQLKDQGCTFHDAGVV